MRVRTIYTVHRRIAICFGVVLLCWLVSGIVMILPRSGRRAWAGSPTPVDYHSITLSPADALRALAQDAPGDSPGDQVAAMKLKALLDRVVYEVLLAGGETWLIDAESGRTVEITPTLATEIAHATAGPTASMQQVERLERHDLRWRHGALPVYRIALEGTGSPVLYVDAESGSVVGRSDRWSRIRSVITSLHEFEPVGWLFGGNRIRKIALLFFALVGIVTALTGYYLALPRAKARAKARST